MKSNNPKLLMGLFTALIIGACSQDVDRKMSDREEGLNVSDISLIEQSLGKPLFKVDQIFTDAIGNTLTIRFASLNKDLLDDYIRATKYSVTFEAVTETPHAPAKASQISESFSMEPDVEIGYDQKIVVETISKSFRKGTGGYVVHVEPRESNTSGRIMRDGWWVEHTSDAWPEQIWVYNYTADYIHYKLYRKWNWSDVSWGSYFFITSFYGPSDVQDIDGPWKVRLNLNYDHSTGSYDFRWYDADTNTYYQ